MCFLGVDGEASYVSYNGIIIVKGNGGVGGGGGKANVCTDGVGGGTVVSLGHKGTAGAGDPPWINSGDGYGGYAVIEWIGFTK